MSSTFKIVQSGHIVKNDCIIRINHVGGSCVDVRASIPTTSKVSVFLNITYSSGGVNQEDMWLISIPLGTESSYRTCYGMSGDDVEILKISLDGFTPEQDATTIYEVIV